MAIYDMLYLTRPSEPIEGQDNAEHLSRIRVRALSELQARRAAIEAALHNGLLVSGFTSILKKGKPV
jgi:hypothetical protein